MLAPLRRRVKPVRATAAYEAVVRVIAVVYTCARRKTATAVAVLIPRARRFADTVLALTVMVSAMGSRLPLCGSARRVANRAGSQ